jgi:hypothetical protein
MKISTTALIGICAFATVGVFLLFGAKIGSWAAFISAGILLVRELL